MRAFEAKHLTCDDGQAVGLELTLMESWQSEAIHKALSDPAAACAIGDELLQPTAAAIASDLTARENRGQISRSVRRGE